MYSNTNKTGKVKTTTLRKRRFNFKDVISSLFCILTYWAGDLGSSEMWKLVPKRCDCNSRKASLVMHKNRLVTCSKRQQKWVKNGRYIHCLVWFKTKIEESPWSFICLFPSLIRSSSIGMLGSILATDTLLDSHSTLRELKLSNFLPCWSKAANSKMGLR